MKTQLLGATFAALLPLAMLQACTVGDAGEDIGIAPDEIVELDDCTPGEMRWCDQDIDLTVAGEQTCIVEEDDTGWAGCAPRAMNGPEDCYEEEEWDGEACRPFSGQVSTPIVLSFDAAPVAYRTAGGDFDLTGRGFNVQTDWPTAQTPWLALDRDGDGEINSGAELFGSATRLADGTFARHGFEALAELDDNQDGALTAADAAFAKLRVWADDNGDRTSQDHEMRSLAELGINSLSLDVHVGARCDARSNCERERASFSYEQAGERRVGMAIDVHLAWQ